MEKKRNKDYKADTTPEKSFTAYIVKGNRQVVEREVMASKRFRVEAETYIIKDKCIFLKNIGGVIKSVSYYREGNPNPYDFNDVNNGITPLELDNFFAEDFYNIIVNVKIDKRARIMLTAVLMGFMVNLVYIIGVVIRVFLLR